MLFKELSWPLKKFKPAKAPKYSKIECNGKIRVKNLKTGKTQVRKKKSK